ncbi:MAG TPA: tetratricopeptide repeat protein [Rhizomicrobium sp.]|jgi:tetratricopeptide (TPR) repeat protein
MRRQSSLFAAIGVCLFTAGCLSPTETGDQPGTPGLDAYKRNQYAAAMEIFQAEAQQYPKNPYVEFNIARTYAATGHRDDAIRYYRMVRIDGQDVDVDSGVVAEGRKNEDLAEAACDHLIAMGVACN